MEGRKRILRSQKVEKNTLESSPWKSKLRKRKSSVTGNKSEIQIDHLIKGRTPLNSTIKMNQSESTESKVISNSNDIVNENVILGSMDDELIMQNNVEDFSLAHLLLDDNNYKDDDDIMDSVFVTKDSEASGDENNEMLMDTSSPYNVLNSRRQIGIVSG